MKVNNKQMMALCTSIIMIFSALSMHVLAQDLDVIEDESRDSLQQSIYVTNDKINKSKSNAEGINTTNIDTFTSNCFDDANIIIVDFEELYADHKFALSVAEQIRCGKIFYFRADGYSANRSIISNLLGVADSAGYIRESTDDEIVKRDGTFGYIVFINASGKLQIVRQMVSFVDQITPVSEFEENSSIGCDINVQDIKKVSLSNNVQSNISKESIGFSFADEMDAIDSFLDEYSPTDVNKVIEIDDQGLCVQSTFSSYAYEVLYDTHYYYFNVHTSSDATRLSRKIGAVTRAMYAERLYCASSGFSDNSKISSKWGYMTDIWMQPTWNQSTFYRSFNYKLAVRFNTFPRGTGNDTYMMIFRDYTPGVDLSGKTDVTLSVGADAAYDNGTKLSGSAGFSVSTSYKDVEITVPQWQTGKSYSNNVAGWEFIIGKALTRYTTNPVATSTIKLPAGVVLWNYSNKYSCVQLNFDASWYINQGFLNINDLCATASGAVVWCPAYLY